tara:strand:+ start:2894 stop:3508 length:615 start_codon:yes stop_codon:yes gene_type:complete
MQNYYNNCLEVGLDEVARGCLLGRVYTAGVVWNNDFNEDEDNLNKFKIIDSKKLSKKKREETYNYIIDNVISWNVSYMTHKDIDKKNILNATLDCFHKCIDGIDVDIESIIVDGTHFNSYKNIPHECIEKGDNKYYSIAAASIIAKVTHDKYIEDLCLKHPELNEKYDLLNNMGYGTAKHIDGIKKYGLSKFHRKTFGICKTFY